MTTRKELEQAGYRKIAQTHGGVAQATFYNPNTEDSFTLIVDDVDDYDVPAIMDELYYSGIEYSIDQLSYDGFVEILKRHDLSENWQ